MSQSLLLVALPYAALAAFVIGVIVRFRSQATISSESSQILESRWLAWGTLPFHAGIAILFFGHLIPLLIPDSWRALVSHRAALLAVESIGAAAGVLSLLGLLVLLVRRLASRSVQASSNLADILVLAVLILQVAAGLTVAALYRWGAVWSIGTTVPYLRSLITFRPEPAFVAGVPGVMTMHLAGAWVVLALLPFTRLVHMLTFPFRYLSRPPLRVVWMRRLVIPMLLLACCATPVPIRFHPHGESAPIVAFSNPSFADGDPTAGRQAFIAMQCIDCHRVAEDPELPRGARAIAGPLLGGLQHYKPAELAQRITSRETGASQELFDRTMKDYAQPITARQLVDIVAYLRNPKASRR